MTLAIEVYWVVLIDLKILRIAFRRLLLTISLVDSIIGLMMLLCLSLVIRSYTGR